MAWRIEIEFKAEKELARIDTIVAKRIYKFLYEYLQHVENPRIDGEALKGNLSHLWRYRVGDYRILTSIEDKSLLITAVRIQHRRKVYRNH